MFSSFFSAKIQNTHDKLDQTPLQPCPPTLPFTGTPLFCFHPVSETEVLNTLKSVSFKSGELSPIPASLFSNCLPYLLPAITGIANASLRTGFFLTAFKIHKFSLRRSSFNQLFSSRGIPSDQRQIQCLGTHIYV